MNNEIEHLSEKGFGYLDWFGKELLGTFEMLFKNLPPNISSHKINPYTTQFSTSIFGEPFTIYEAKVAQERAKEHMPPPNIPFTTEVVLDLYRRLVLNEQQPIEIFFRNSGLQILNSTEKITEELQRMIMCFQDGDYDVMINFFQNNSYGMTITHAGFAVYTGDPNTALFLSPTSYFCYSENSFKTKYNIDTTVKSYLYKRFEAIQDANRHLVEQKMMELMVEFEYEQKLLQDRILSESWQIPLDTPNQFLSEFNFFGLGKSDLRIQGCEISYGLDGRAKVIDIDLMHQTRNPAKCFLTRDFRKICEKYPQIYDSVRDNIQGRGFIAYAMIHDSIGIRSPYAQYLPNLSLLGVKKDGTTEIIFLGDNAMFF